MENYIKEVQNVCIKVFDWATEFRFEYNGDYPYLIVKYWGCSDNKHQKAEIIGEILNSAEFEKYDVFVEQDPDNSEFGVMPGKNFEWPECEHFETECNWGTADLN